MAEKAGTGRPAKKTLGLGFLPDEARHGFVLHLPTSQAETADVSLSEYRDFVIEDGHLRLPPVTPNDPTLRVILKRNKWNEIASAFWEESSRRLKKAGIAAIKLPKKGDIPIDPSLGKELCVLCWAIEEADATLIPGAVRNWEGLAPEERWWLFTMTAGATGQAMQTGVGWRKALRFALTENPIVKGEGMAPRVRKQLLDSYQMSLV